MFDFFGIPRELRDKCYEEMLIPQIGLPSASELKKEEADMQLFKDMHRTFEEERAEERRLNTYSEDEKGTSRGNRIEDTQSEEQTGSAKAEDQVSEHQKIDSRLEAGIAPYATVQVLRAPRPRLMLVSRQVREEYLSTAQRCMSIRTNVGLLDTFSIHLMIPPVFRCVRSINLWFSINSTCRGRLGLIENCEVHRQLWLAHDYFDNLLGQLQKPEISIEVLLTSRESAMEGCKEVLLDHQTLLTETAGLERLLVRTEEEPDERNDHWWSGDLGAKRPMAFKLNQETMQLASFELSDPENALDPEVARYLEDREDMKRRTS